MNQHLIRLVQHRQRFRTANNGIINAAEGRFILFPFQSNSEKTQKKEERRRQYHNYTFFHNNNNNYYNNHSSILSGSFPPFQKDVRSHHHHHHHHATTRNPIIASRHHDTTLLQQQKSLFHSSSKKEILPLVALGTVIVLGTYSYKALQKMDEEWEEYEDALEEYKLEHGLSEEDIEHIRMRQTATTTTTTNEGVSSSASTEQDTTIFRQGKLAIDLGSMNIRIGYLPPNNQEKKNSRSSGTKPKLVVNREGGRSTPNSIFVDTDGSVVTGSMANSKLLERSQSNNPVLNPYQLLQRQQQQQEQGKKNNENDITTITYAVENAISTLAKDALEQVLGGSSSNSSSSSEKVSFSIDTMSGSGNHNNVYNTQPIFTYPVISKKKKNDDEELLNIYEQSIRPLVSPSHIAKFLPEPICAVRGARYHKLLPTKLSPSSSSKSIVMVIDIGGKTTSISLVNEDGISSQDKDSSINNNIQYHTSIPNFGGETLIETVMNHLSKSFYNVDQIHDVKDTMGIQRIYDASKAAIMEMSGSKHGRVQINIPYLSVDEKMQPRHLDVGLSKNVFEAKLEEMIKDEIIPKCQQQETMSEEEEDDGLLSQSMKDPKDLQGLFSSVIMNVFEKSGINPFELTSVLVIGGGARSTLYQKKIKGALGSLAGDQFVQEKVVIPVGAKGEELVVIGALLDD